MYLGAACLSKTSRGVGEGWRGGRPLRFCPVLFGPGAVGARAVGRPVFQEGIPGRQPLGLPRPRFTVVGGAGVTGASASGVGP